MRAKVMQEDKPRRMELDALLASRQFIQIPGPNPILVPGVKGSWDETLIEAADIFKDHDTYYLYYHGVGAGKGYRLGVATATHPLGPWIKYEGNPIVEIGESGQWDDRQLGCALILKDGIDKYYMWYSGHSVRDEDQVWHVGLATASSPLGPWEKHAKNPVLKDFGYVGGVVKADDEFRMYNEYPIGGTGRDYGPIALATSSSPEGPWRKHPGGPVLHPGEMGCWDDGGFSEAKVSHKDGIFHLFYGGAKLHPTRICTRESIGYAYSFDGVRFFKHPDNPIAVRERSPDAAAFAEVHSLFEHPFVYLYHTLRYNSREGDEDLGVQVLATQRPFRLRMPLVIKDHLAAGETTRLSECPPVSCEHIAGVALTASCTYAASDAEPLQIAVRTSYDGLTYDTEDLCRFEIACRPGQTVRQTFEFSPKAMFIKIVVENPDDQADVSDVSVYAALSG